MTTIAIVGAGISGLSAAWLLNRRYEVRVFEREGRPGGHSNTILVERPAGPRALDTGFLVYNRETYPNLCRLFEILGVASRESDMSFSVSCESCDLSYCGTGLSGLFAQPSNLFRLSFHRMLADIVRFNRIAPRVLDEPGSQSLTVAEYLLREGFSPSFGRHYLLPMGAAVWSSGTRGIGDFPIAMLVRFFQNHGFLGVTTQFRWRTVTGGSLEYVSALTRDFASRIHLGTGVTRVARDQVAKDVVLTFGDGTSARFDRVVLATHADEALALLSDPNSDETRLLGAFPYSQNETILHTDRAWLPKRRAAAASWNYRLEDCARPPARVSVTYHLNRLQAIEAEEDYLVTLNPSSEIPPATVLKRLVYTHPTFTSDGLAAQSELPSLNGARGTYFCGAYHGYGFHEDGLVSGIRVAEALGVPFP